MKNILQINLGLLYVSFSFSLVTAKGSYNLTDKGVTIAVIRKYKLNMYQQKIEKAE